MRDQVKKRGRREGKTGERRRDRWLNLSSKYCYLLFPFLSLTYLNVIGFMASEWVDEYM